MKVSVIISTYNWPSALESALEGFALQRRFPDEVVVADDGSSPETGEVVTKMKGILPFPLLHVWHEDKGFRLAMIRNEAIKASSGEYLLFFDGDCIPNRNFVYDHLALVEAGCFVQGKRILVGKEAAQNLSARHVNSKTTVLKLALSGGLSNRHHIIRMPVFPARKTTDLRGIKGCNIGAFKRDVLAVNGFNEDFEGWGREDSEFASRLFKYGLKKKQHPFMAICYHLWHPEAPRNELARNDVLLREAVFSDGYRCDNGIIKSEGAEA